MRKMNILIDVLTVAAVLAVGVLAVYAAFNGALP